MTSTFTELNTINNSLNNIKNSLNNKNLTPTGDITTYATAINNYTIPIGINREVDANGVYGMPTTSFTFSLPSNATNLSDYILYYAFYNCTGLTSADLSNLITVSSSYALRTAFQNCTGLTSIDLSSLTTISGSSALYIAFQNCTGLTSIDLSSLTTVSGSQVLSGAFYGCTGLNNKSISFPALTSTSFGSYTNQFFLMLGGITGCTVHFPSNLQSVISNWTDVINGFSGTNTTVLFDLPATT